MLPGRLRFSGVLKSMLGDRVQVVVLKNAGHAMAPEQPKAMADAIGAFARDCYKEPSRTGGAVANKARRSLIRC